MENNKVIIIGATSGIGKELARIYHKKGFVVGVTGRRIELLEKLKADLRTNISYVEMDVTKNSAIGNLETLIEKIGGMDLIIINSGTGFINPKLDFEKEKVTVSTNVDGFLAITLFAFNYFNKKSRGHIVGISSVAALRGGPAPAYNASKAFISNYLEGLRFLASKRKSEIYITDIKPGFVDTAMVNSKKVFWMATPAKAANQIYKAILKRKKHAYITKRWWLAAQLYKILPDFIYFKE
ncbi:MAG: SDR family NAD(P)-dependent oxidoreductase [Melioribacteraceae bacterium]|nr:SDR family NAD(P)-dependent oxidoreductase [Melioribacteraceae bacterium]